MNIIHRTFAFIFASILISTSAIAQKTPKQYTAFGVGAYDGDSPTIRVKDSNGKDSTFHIRLWGTDAPEHNSIYVDSTQPYSNESAKFMRELIKGQIVTVYPMYRDDFGRSVCKVVVSDSINVNELSLKTGNSWYRVEPKMTRVESRKLKQYQEGASKIEIGLWKPTRFKPVKPSDWRRKYSGWHQQFIQAF